MMKNIASWNNLAKDCYIPYKIWELLDVQASLQETNVLVAENTDNSLSF